MKLSIRKKMWFGFSILLILMILIGGTSYFSTKLIIDEYEHLIDDRVHNINIVDDLISSQKDSFIAINGYIVYKNLHYMESWDAAVEQSGELLNELEGSLNNEKDIALLDVIKETRLLYNEKVEETAEMIMRGSDRQVRELGLDAAGNNTWLMENAQELKHLQQLGMAETQSNLRNLVQKANIISFSLLGLGLLLSIIVATVISRGIAKPVAIMTQAIEKIAAGDLTAQHVVIKNRDEIGDMASSFNRMTDDLKNLLGRIRLSSQQLASQAEELSASSEESLASAELVAGAAEENMRGSEQQTTIVGETAHSMHSLQNGVSEIAMSNAEMLESSNKVSLLVTDGSKIVSEVSNQMNTIHLSIDHSAEIIRQMAEQSIEIQKVTSIITEISEQTNLLALNAAIEAARAGEHGKGFAVVAEEVRRLAEQSKTSAFEIEQMMNTIQEETEKAVQSINEGSKSVDIGLSSTANSMNIFNDIELAVGEVNVKVNTVTKAIEHIQTISQDITEGSVEIRKIAEMTAATAQETSAATEQQLAVNEEISSSSQELANVAEELQKEVNRFSI
ncbi:methyl-accepting chemotaxis protein [Sporosarcina siberiensis]|uniref:Methyl-accepting chemotaxis protein n=1 Tax=Sporosarcina siberiensis TaxID=1365606 RepID=A0ABW4SCM2_9BACL